MAAVGVRPMMDVMWTTSVQQDDPYNCDGGNQPRCLLKDGRPNTTIPPSVRRNLRRDLISAVLSTGPVGIGDGVGFTDVELLAPALRNDSRILKPAHMALKLDGWYVNGPFAGQSIWTAVSAPARDVDARSDRRADSRALLIGPAGATAGHWWWTILTTRVAAAIKPLEMEDLWPQPPAGASFLVSESFGFPTKAVVCVDGAVASSCLAPWNADQPLNISAPDLYPHGVPAGGVSGLETLAYRLLNAAPVLGPGWVLLGDTEKFVPASPQRLLVGKLLTPGEHPPPPAGDSLDERELFLDSGLCFAVTGSKGEKVAIAVVVPAPSSSRSPLQAALAGRVHRVRVTIGPSGVSQIRCTIADGCAAMETQSYLV
eukprot:gnl/TRDRNA2_/TRDRNA2_125365_c0_seq1.p1 gnl/TRDRNA2_/TRDRNA2_125365_c0~~gnl/TRDRNA2_/TRDRNA2_125365_c0_seq1.p1  ORF type:complete len:384 (+),score=51.32 gnl/TRDRNA2_/TRDRNA2_125365_c0_seq1:38-1153(+)